MPSAFSTRRLLAMTATLFVIILVFLSARVQAGGDPTQAATPAAKVTPVEPTPAPGDAEPYGTDDPYGADPYGEDGSAPAAPDADPPTTSAS